MMKKLMMIVLPLFVGVFVQAAKPGRVAAQGAGGFSIESGFYKDQGKWLAVNPNKGKTGEASVVFPYRDGVYDVALEMVGENDGQSTFEVLIEQKSLGTLICPTSSETYEVGAKFNQGWSKVQIFDGDIIRVRGTVASADGQEWSRARWAGIRFTPVDDGPALESSEAKPAAGVGLLVPLFGERMPDGDGSVIVGGELKQWHMVVLTLDGPFAHELDNEPNPFVHRRMNVRFSHESGSPTYTVPGYFAADGHAGESSAEAGTKWRAHLSPDKTGTWSYAIEFEGTPYDGKSGEFSVAVTDKTDRDFRGKGRLEYVGKRYLKFAGSGEYFLKAGADAPETLLGYSDFDGTVANNPKKCPLKSYSAHVKDWKVGDPVWKGEKGKGLIGAINYLASTGCNAFSFLPYNAGGDGDNVWPHVSRSDKLHFDCSKLDQWGKVFSHGTAMGMYLHFKLQETENDDLRGKNEAGKAQSLDKGLTGIERKTYLREMIARYGHNLALNWNLGEENTQTYDEQMDMARYIRATDPYGHNLVLHTYPGSHESVYGPMLGDKEALSGLSMQNSNVGDCHWQSLKWVTESEAAGHPWVVAFDEPGNASAGTPPDPDWPGMAEALAGLDQTKLRIPSIDDIRSEVIWGNFMAGGAGVEHYFGYRLPENDLLCENWRSRAKTWGYSRYALEFFKDNRIPLVEMKNANALVANPKNKNSKYCLAQPGKSYVVYLRSSETADLDLCGVSGKFSVQWYNPREGGALQEGSVKQVDGGGLVSLGDAPADPNMDWVVLIKASR